MKQLFLVMMVIMLIMVINMMILMMALIKRIISQAGAVLVCAFVTTSAAISSYRCSSIYSAMKFMYYWIHFFYFFCLDSTECHFILYLYLSE